jgi:threonyl-tRNA synthetase
LQRYDGGGVCDAIQTRPATKLGDDALWDTAEAALQESLDQFCAGTTRSPGLDVGGGAFYGPKIDIKVCDALGREHQCATVQLDFQLPLRFDLNYQGPATAEGAATTLRPVIIHRAILGSCERMIAVLTEHFGGKWPFWLSPRQIIVIPIAKDHMSYAAQVADRLKAVGFYCDVETRNLTINKAVREAQMAQYNFFLCVGKNEMTDGTVTVRKRNQDAKERPQVKPVDVVIQDFIEMVRKHE